MAPALVDQLPSAFDAYEVEQRVLRRVHEQRWSGTGEFVIAPATALIEAIRSMLLESW